MSQTNRKKIYRQQTMGYFINAAIEIIDKEGITGLSIRKTAERAGYNSATLYHYFADFEELCIFAAMKFLDEYAKDLPHYLKQASSPLEQHLKVWECFCIHSFTHPDIFWLLFFKQKDKNWDFSHYFEAYYDIFPDNWNDELNSYRPMFASEDLYTREFISLSKALSEESLHLPETDIRSASIMNNLIYRGMLETLREDSDFFAVPEAVEQTLTCLKKTLIAYGIK